MEAWDSRESGKAWESGEPWESGKSGESWSQRAMGVRESSKSRESG